MKLPKRKPTRLKKYDYSTSGAYFVTICTHNKKCVLSRILVGEGLCALPINNLSPIGIAVEKSIQFINNNYNNVTIDKYIIMPNHVHLLVVLNDSGGHGNPPLQEIIGRMKSHTTHNYGDILWQRSYHDHILRSENDYKRIWEYIDTNAFKWKSDCFYIEENGLYNKCWGNQQ